MSEDEARGKRRRADEPAAAPAAAPATASAAAPDDVQAKIDYQKAGAYWDSVDATIDGVLGGFGHLTDVDLRDSHAFFQRQPSLAPRTPRPGTLACDCGAGIGRVAKGLLLDYCEKVDIVEQCKKYTDASWRFVGKECIREVLTVGLQASLPSAPTPPPPPPRPPAAPPTETAAAWSGFQPAASHLRPGLGPMGNRCARPSLPHRNRPLSNLAAPHRPPAGRCSGGLPRTLPRCAEAR